MSPSLPPEQPFPPGEWHHNKVRPTPIPFFSATRARERFKRLPVPQKLFFWICSALILLSSLFGGVAYGVYAANQPVKLPVGQTKTTLSTFFQQGKNAKSAPVKVIPKPEKGKPYWQDELISKEVQKPSSAPATMKAVSQTLSLSTSPAVTPTPQPSPTPSATPVPTVSPTPELTPTPTPGKGKPTPTPTLQTGEATPTVTPDPTESPAETPSPTPTPTPEQQSTSGGVLPLFSSVMLAASPTPEASPTPIESSSGLVPSSELRLVGTDANGPLVELVIPAGALDLSGAKTAQGTAPQGDLTMTLTQLHGHFAAESKMLGSFQFQMVDEEGQDVSGITLLSPATIIYHYQPTEMAEMSMDAGNLVMTWSPTATPETASATATESTEETSGGSSAIPMSNDATTLTLSAPIGTLETAVVALAIENPANLSPPTPLVGSSGGNTGQYGYSYPLTVAPGPPDTTPQLLLNYSSGGTNERHSPLAPAGPAGEGWGLSLGSISAEEYPDGTIWYSLSGVAGISDRLIPATNGTDFETEHLSYLKIKKVTVNSQPCFRIWDTVGNFYELGCTSDSLQYNKLSDGTRENYRWDLNRVIPAKNVLDSDTNKRVMTITYIQQTDDINGHTYIRDAAPKQITYGNATVAGVVRFFYQGPNALTEGGIPWITDYSPAPGNVTTNCDPAGSVTTHLRCDNPINHPDGLKKPQIMSTLVLKEIKTYVGNAANLYFSYALTHQDSPFYECRESTSDAKAYCAGHHLLTQITPTAYKAGVGQVLPASVFFYSGELSNTYVDTAHTVAGDPYRVETKWKYLSAHMDLQMGVGSNIMYHRAYGNTHGTPALPDGDNRYDALFCTWSPNLCTAAPFSRPDEKQWSVQVVTSITNSGKDSSSGSLLPATTSFQYWLTHTSDDCDPDSNGLDDCVRYTWIPPSDNAWQSFYHAEFRGFGTVLITSPSGHLTVQNYATTEGWSTSQTASGNYTAGSLLQEQIYQGGAMDESKLLKKTRNYYAGNLLDTGVDTDNSCNAGFTTSVYKPCAVMVIKRITNDFEQGGVSATAPTVTRTYTFDNYTNANGLGDHHQAPSTGAYGNLLQEVIESSNAPTITKKWSYYTTNTTVNSTVFYNVRKVAYSELVDATGHKWLCQDTIYDEKIAPALPKPAAGWPTTGKTSSDCTNPAGTTKKSYTGYDTNGNVVASVDAVGAATPSLYTSTGCTLVTAPAFFPISSWSPTRYNICTKYDAAGVMPTDSWNALSHDLATSYDATQGLRPVSITDVNDLVTTTSYSYDSSGNTTVSVKTPGEPGSYTGQASSKTTCTTASTLPCFEINNHVSLYPGAISRAFYDSQGRPVQSQTPGPGANQTTISFTVYHDQAGTVFSSVPFVVPTRTTWLDPNGATDIDGVTPGGTMTTFDALGRTLTMTDPLGNLARMSYGLGIVSGDPKLYAKVTSVDANQHVTMGYADALSRARYSFSYSGVYGGTLTANTRVVTQYNALDLPISVTVTDLVPQGGQAVTEKVTTSQYDDQGMVLSVTDPDRGTITYTTNANGQVIKEVRGSRILGSSYDLLGRVGCLQEGEVTASMPGACGGGTPLVEYTYDAYPASVGWSNTNTLGKLTQVVGSTYLADAGNTRGIVTENVQYNVRGLPIKQRMRIEVSGGTLTLPTLPVYELTQAYNNANQPTTTQTTVDGQAGLTSTNAFDSTTGVLVGLSNTTTGSSNLAELSYNARGLMADLIFKNSAGASLATTHLLYDGNLRPASSTTSWQSGGTIYTDGVGYDAIGNVMSKVSTHAQIGGSGGGNETQNYCYDEMNRLMWAGNNAIPVAETGEHCGNAATQETLGGAYTSRFAYTHLGHLWQGPLGGQGAQQQYLYCNPAKPHQVSHLSPTTGNPNCGDPGATVYTASYDAFGNLSTRTTNGEINTLTFDVFDQLTHWSTFGGGKQEWYLYNASGERVVRYSIDGANKTLTVYAIGGDEHQYQIDASNNLTNTRNTSYYALGGSLIGMLTTGSGGANPATTFLLTDSLGSVVAHFSNEAVGSQVLGSQLYDPYGNERYQQGEIGTDRGFTGQYKDSLSGLNYYGARYYDPLIGRFLSEDAVAGGDPYAYVGGNPLAFTDPSGQRAMMPYPGGGDMGGGGISTPSPQPVCFNCGTEGNGPKVGVIPLKNTGGGGSGGCTDCGGGNNSTNGKDKTDNGGTTQKGSGSHPNNAWHKAKEAIVKLAKTGSPEAAAIVELGMDVIDLFFNFSGMANDIAILGDENASDGDKFWAAADLGLQILLNVASFTGAGAAGKIAQFASRMKGLGHVIKFADDAVKWGKGLWDNAVGWFGKACSFTPETVVATSAGMVPIGNLQVGQQVWAYSETTGQMQLQPIVHVWINLDDDLVDLTITQKEPSADGKGETQISEVIHTNKKHPFLTVEKGFLPAGELVLGMHVVRADGSVGTVSGWQVVPGSQKMYNLEVAKDHTFTVGDGQWVVHNCPPTPSGNNPANITGNNFHYDQLNGGPPGSVGGPSQLQSMFPSTTFDFKRRGVAGADVEVLGGTHPSAYSGSNWPGGQNIADFKPDTRRGQRQFRHELNNGKLPPGTVPIWYDPVGYVITRIG